MTKKMIKKTPEMMSKTYFRQIVPYLAAIIIFLGITLIYFSPLLEGKKLKQHDIAMFKGMSKEIVDFRAKTGEEPLWTNSMFGGMPAWQISVKYSGNLMMDLDRVIRLGLPGPADYVFLYFLGFFILLLIMKVDPWVAIVGSIAYALSSYFFIILGAGHTSKAHAIGYMAPVLAGIIWTYRGHIWKGSLLTAVALSLEILSGHLQITYYLLILVAVYVVYVFFKDIKEKKLPYFLKASGLLIIAASFAVLTNITSFLGTYEYSQYTMRGKPVLTKEKKIKSGGLDKDYITAWSYGIGETWSLLFPDVKGGASGYIGKEFSKELKDTPAQFRQIISQQNAYWGNQPGTSGPVYVGAIVVFLFVLGMFVLRDKFKWAMLIATILAIMLAWGKNFMGLTDFFIDYIPGYNKFRAVSMILVIVELTIPLIAIMGLDRIIKNPAILRNKMNWFYASLALTVGIGLLFYIFPTLFFPFFSKFEMQQFSQLRQSNNAAQVTAFMDALQNVRIVIFRQDILRSIFFILIASGLLYAFILGRLKSGWMLFLLGILILIDMVGVDRRYLNNSNFEIAKKAEVPFHKTLADRYIDKDKSPDFRVVDITKNVFNDASTSYFHESIGGYHGAKLQRYQDLIDFYLLNDINNLRKVFTQHPTLQSIDSVLRSDQTLDMLNTKYIIYNPNAEPILNPYAFGNAWITHKVKWVKNADSAIVALGKTNLRDVAVVDKVFSNILQSSDFIVDSSATIKMTSYAPNLLRYQFNSKSPQLVVFSEIYYPLGWEVTIDGKKAQYFRADYLLRAMTVPAGNHQIVFKFKPKVWSVGEVVSFISSLLLLLLTVWVLFVEIRKFFRNLKNN